MRKLLVLAIVLSAAGAHADPDHPAMYQVADDGSRTELPLVRARAHVDVRGPIASVALTQYFANPADVPIEAVYEFPLPDQGAVGGMTMTLGDRTIRAKIEKRDVAEKAYDQAKQDGKAAALLTQARPNVFTQSVANILPGETIEIALRYDILLAPVDGTYELALPTVIGPRYKDVDGVNPPYAEAGTDTGNTFDVDLDVDAAVPIATIESPTHAILATRVDDHHYQVALAGDAAVANKDFVLRWAIASDDIAVAVLADKEPDDDLGHVALVIQPPDAGDADASPRELDFIVDTSGSMDGEPLSLAKQGMRYALARLDPGDAFRIFHFSNEVAGFDGGALTVASEKNVRRALSWVNGLTADGGTEMMPAVEAALPGTAPEGGRTRYVVFMTDGYVGNEDEILRDLASRRDPSSFLFSFGVGSSTNRYLLDGLAEQGGGVARYLLLDEKAAPQIEAFFGQIAKAMLTDVKITWDGVTITDQVRDGGDVLFAGMPIVVSGRYARGGKGTVSVHAMRGKDEVSVDIPVLLPDTGGDGAALGRLWARRRIAELDRARIAGSDPDAQVAAITAIALAHSLMTDYTAFVAVDTETRVDAAGVRVEVPSEMPEGVSMSAEYTSNIPTGRTFGGVLGGAAGSQGDVYGTEYGGETITISGRAPIIDVTSTQMGITIVTDRLAREYVSDGVPLTETPGLRWHRAIDAFALLGTDIATLGVSASIERRMIRRLALGLAAGLYDPNDGTAFAALMATVGRWFVGPGFDLRLGVGPALDRARDLGLAGQLRVGMPLPWGKVRPDLELRLDAATVGEQRTVGAGLGVGVRF